jgi:hypothetical protein
MYTERIVYYMGYIYRVSHELTSLLRMFLMLNYTDITQNTYIRSLTVSEIMAGENCGHLESCTHYRYPSAAHNPCLSLCGVSCYRISAYGSQESGADAVMLQIANTAVISCCDDCAVTVKMSFSYEKYADMHFVYGFCNGNTTAAVKEYRL